MWIQNISMQRLIDGDHTNPGKNSVLIQIVDPGRDFPKPKYKFSEINQYRFLDLEDTDNWGHEYKITDAQALDIVNNLGAAINNNKNVIVHCHMGLCRSGAVCEVGVMMGFKDRKTHRIPNLLVKHKLMKALGWTYD
jgi:predicted protein tyrosine phosphatase